MVIQVALQHCQQGEQRTRSFAEPDSCTKPASCTRGAGPHGACRRSVGAGTPRLWFTAGTIYQHALIAASTININSTDSSSTSIILFIFSMLQNKERWSRARCLSLQQPPTLWCAYFPPTNSSRPSVSPTPTSTLADLTTPAKCLVRVSRTDY